MKVLVSGGTGLVGRYIVEGLLAAGYQVILGGRTPPESGLFAKPVGFVPLSLDPAADQIDAFTEAYFFVHAAFDHIPGKYRGGEGDDPERFRRLNLDGTVKLFETARKAGIRRTVFLSSRAVYDGLPSDVPLREEATLRPSSLYGEIKLYAEHALAALSAPGFATASLRATGVYGDLQPNKWDAMFSDFLAGRDAAMRAGTEVHGRDLAAAVRLMLEAEVAKIDGHSFNVSDIVTDTAEILTHFRRAGQFSRQRVAAADRGSVRAMPTDRITALGWNPGGHELLASTIETIANDKRWRLTSSSLPTGFSEP